MQGATSDAQDIIPFGLDGWEDQHDSMPDYFAVHTKQNVASTTPDADMSGDGKPVPEDTTSSPSSSPLSDGNHDASTSPIITSSSSGTHSSSSMHDVTDMSGTSKPVPVAEVSGDRKAYRKEHHPMDTTEDKMFDGGSSPTGSHVLRTVGRGLKCKKSLLSSAELGIDAGLGVFASRSSPMIVAGELVCQYQGKLITAAEVNSLKEKGTVNRRLWDVTHEFSNSNDGVLTHRVSPVIGEHTHVVLVGSGLYLDGREQKIKSQDGRKVIFIHPDCHRLSLMHLLPPIPLISTSFLQITQNLLPCPANYSTMTAVLRQLLNTCCHIQPLAK